MLDDDNIEILDDDNNTSSSNFNNVGKRNINDNDSKNLKDKIEQGKTNNQNNRNANSQMPVGGPNNGNQFKNSGNLAKLSNAAGASNSDDPNAQTQALKSAGKEAIKPIVRKGVQAATGGLVGSGPVTSKIIDKAVDKAADNPNVDKIIDDATKKINKVKRKAVFSFIVGFVGPLLPILIIFSIFCGLFLPVFGSSINNDEKQNKYEKKYYNEMDRIANLYNSSCEGEFNETLIGTTIFYDQIIYNDSTDIEYFDEEDSDITTSFNKKVNYKGKADDIKKLSNQLYPNFDFSDGADNSSASACTSSYSSYKSYLNSYVKNNYKKLPDDVNYDRVVDEILMIGGYSDNTIANAYKGSYYCQGVTVLDSNNDLIGTYDLETYVAGVVAGESYTQYGIEALKAQAIVARTFLLKTTNNCKNPIQSGQNRQVFKETTDDKAIQATKETEGLVLQYDSELISAQYDSFCYDDSDCPDSKCNDTECSVTYTKLPNEEKHVIRIPVKWKSLFVPGGGHARGMSQLAAYDMAENGSLYDQILYTFYSPGVEIVAMGGLISGANFTSSIEPPLNADVIKERTKNGDQFYNSSKGLISQCPWYAKSRASEILYYSNIPDNVKDAAIKSITNTGGNGADVVNNIDETLFQKSYDYTQPHPGAVVSWKSSAKDGASCHNYGHVAIVEQVKENGTILISEGWNGGGTEAANVWSNIRYSIREVSLDYMSGYTNSRGCRYTFNGYAYLLG